MGGPRDPGEHIDSPQPAHIDGDPVAAEEPVEEAAEEVETESDDGEEVEGA
ncbi:MAG: hypothetical protein KAI25_07770 [Hyphomicrobiaceae bacterium]|nr:hypothetical protein [Hyphomicrobiaceae bacterium]MCK5712596.1 hypothetical protein [Hyphomicrobiaceae bacterium]